MAESSDSNVALGQNQFLNGTILDRSMWRDPVKKFAHHWVNDRSSHTPLKIDDYGQVGSNLAPMQRDHNNLLKHTNNRLGQSAKDLFQALQNDDPSQIHSIVGLGLLTHMLKGYGLERHFPNVTHILHRHLDSAFPSPHHLDRILTVRDHE
jgi:hypothetical protein